MLAMYPEYQEKVYEEIKSVLPPGQTTVTADVINRLNYTDRLIKETLRLFPTIPIITRITRSEMKIGKKEIRLTHKKHFFNVIIRSARYSYWYRGDFVYI